MEKQIRAKVVRVDKCILQQRATGRNKSHVYCAIWTTRSAAAKRGQRQYRNKAIEGRKVGIYNTNVVNMFITFCRFCCCLCCGAYETKAKSSHIQRAVRRAHVLLEQNKTMRAHCRDAAKKRVLCPATIGMGPVK